MESRQLGYTDNEGNYVPVNKEEQHSIEKQIEERQRMEEEIVNPQPGSRMEEEESNDIIGISKEENKEGKTDMESENYDMVLKEMEKQEEFEKKIKDNNKIVPWLHTAINKTVWKRGKLDKIDGIVPEGPILLYQQAAVGRAINIQFSYETSNKMQPIEIKSYEGKKSQGIEFKKEEITKYIGKVGQFNKSEMVSSKEVSKTVIKILIEYKTPRDDYTVYYMMTIDKWSVKISKIKEVINPMLNEDLSDRTFLPDEYKNEPKEFNIRMYKKAKFTMLDPYPYVQTEEEMKKNYRPRPPTRVEYYYKIPEEIQERRNKWLEKRKELLNDIRAEREKKRKSVKPRKRFSDIKGELMKLEEKKKIIKEYDDGARQLEKELIKIDMSKDDSTLTPKEKELAVQKRFNRKEEIREKVREINKKRNEEFENSKVMRRNERRIREEFLESIKDEEEIDMMPKYEMLKVDMKKYKKGDVYGYTLSEDKVNMTKERYEDLKRERDERMKYFEMQEEIRKSWTEQESNLHAMITNLLNQSGELVEIMRRHNDLNECDEQEMEKVINILSLYQGYVEFEGGPNEIAQKVLEKMEELEKQKEELEKKYEDVKRAHKYVERYNAIKEELERGDNIREQEGEEYSIMEEDDEEGNDKSEKNRAVQWAEQKTDLFIPEMLGYTETDDFYSTSNKLEIKPAGTTITNKKGETKKTESETISLDININKGEKKTRIGIFVTKNRGYITVRLDSDATEEFVEILRNGSIKQVIYTSYLEVAK